MPVKLSFDYDRPDLSMADDRLALVNLEGGTVSIHVEAGDIFVQMDDAQTASVDIMPTGSPLHIDFFFDPASGYSEVMVDGEVLLGESLPIGTAYASHFDAVGLSTYAETGDFTLDNVTLYDNLNKDVNLDEDFEGELCHYLFRGEKNSSYQRASDSLSNNNFVQIISDDDAYARLYKYVPDLHSNIIKIEWDYRVPLSDRIPTLAGDF